MTIILGGMVREAGMVLEVSAVKFRQNLGEMLNQVEYRKDSIVISKDGKPVAALVDAELFARNRQMRGRFDELTSRIVAGLLMCRRKEGWRRLSVLCMRSGTDEGEVEFGGSGFS